MNQYVSQCLDGLTEAVRQSDEYRQFCEAREALAARPELCARIDQYRRDSYSLHNSPEVQDLFAELERLEKEYKELRKEPEAAAFLAAELGMCRMVQNINEQICSMVELELKF